MNRPVRVLLADDSRVARALLRSILDAAADIEVVGEAANGREAVELARELRPDVVSMDLEMPVMNGLDAIEEIMTTKAVPILVVSGAADARHACEAVNRGALDVIAKPGPDSAAAAEFVAKLKMLAGVSVFTRARPRSAAGAATTSHPAVPSAVPGNGHAVAGTSPVSAATTATATATTAALAAAATGMAGMPASYRQVVAIASSTGGPQALAQILGALPADFPAPVLIAQHIADGFAAGMADWLRGLCRMPVSLGREGELLRPGAVYVSPSEAHMAVTPARTLTLQPRREDDLYHPNCDVLLESVAAVFGGKAIGVILTGMGHDGAIGLDVIRRAGGVTLAQDEASSVVFGMNGVAVAQGAAQRVLPLADIAGALRGLVVQNGFAGMAGAWQ